MRSAGKGTAGVAHPGWEKLTLSQELLTSQGSWRIVKSGKKKNIEEAVSVELLRSPYRVRLCASLWPFSLLPLTLISLSPFSFLLSFLLLSFSPPPPSPYPYSLPLIVLPGYVHCIGPAFSSPFRRTIPS